MTATNNRKITLAARPVGQPADSDFKLVAEPVPEPGPEQMLCRTVYLSLDPYMRGRMNEGKSYAATLDIGEVILGETVSEVVSSNLADFKSGDLVLTANGWQEYAISDGREVRKIDPNAAPISTALGVLGMPGMTAYTGLAEIGKPQPGETVVVSAASGAVGAVVGQLAKTHGARAVGIAGGPDKCAYIVDELGFEAGIDYKADNFKDALKSACPDGVDVYWENVGGVVTNTVWPLLNPFSRVPVCGLISYYNATELPAGPDLSPVLMRSVLVNRINIRGFIVYDFADKRQEFAQYMSQWIADGRIKYREDVVEGLENAVAAFQGLLQGKNFGKWLVKVSDAGNGSAA